VNASFHQNRAEFTLLTGKQILMSKTSETMRTADMRQGRRGPLRAGKEAGIEIAQLMAREKQGKEESRGSPPSF
jgi:hypothetical protein